MYKNMQNKIPRESFRLHLGTYPYSCKYVTIGHAVLNAPNFAYGNDDGKKKKQFHLQND